MNRAAFLAMALSGCSYGSYVRSQASQDFSCPRNEIQIEELGDGGAFNAKGCGRAATYLGGVSSSPIARASYDLRCPAAQLKMTYLGNLSIGVDGCGKRSTYSFVDGAWVGNSSP